MNSKTGEVSDTPVGMMDVYQEFNELSERFKIMKFKSKVSANLDHRMCTMNVIFGKVEMFVTGVCLCRKWRKTTLLKSLMFPVSASTWKSDIL